MADVPPPRRQKPTRASDNIAKALADAEAVKKIKEMGQGLLFFDHSSPSVVARREVARQVFEEYCERKLGRTDLSSEEMWNVETICERTYDLLITMAMYAKGKIGDKPKAGVLYQQKEGMYWWIIRFVPTFTTVFQRWHHLATSAIHKAAQELDFETSWYQRNRLTDAELELFFGQLSKFTAGVENWKQHYVAWLQVYMIAIRPGSFTVCPGYAKGSKLPNGKDRTEDDTLRWNDIQFIRRPEGAGIMVKITYRYLKGHRDPHTQKLVEGKRHFTLMPLNSDRYEFDLGLLFTALAYSRGLFPYSSPEALFAGPERIVPKVAAVDAQAVFVASNQDGVLLQDKPMHESSLNPQLQKMCELVGLFARNTMYSLRRTAITEVRRDSGTEAARELAAHVPESNSIYAYDDEGLADADVVNARMNLPAMPRSEIRKMFNQVTTARIVVPMEVIAAQSQLGDAGKGLQEHLNSEASARARADEEYVAKDRALRDALSEIAEHLDVPNALLRDVNDHREQLMSRSETDETSKALLTKMEALLKDRKNILRRLQGQYKKEVKEEMLKKAQKTQKVAETKSGANPLGTRGVSTMEENEIQQQVRQALAAQGSAYANRIETLDTQTNEEEETADDAASDEEEADHGRVEPEQWENLPDNVVLQSGEKEGKDGATAEGRLQFFKTFVGMRGVQNAGLICLSCKMDPTTPFDKKQQTYTLGNLDKHLKTNYHSREAVILRAVKIDLGPGGKAKDKVECPLCHIKIISKQFMKHVEELHDFNLE